MREKKKIAKAERARIQREIRKAKEEQKSLFARKINIRFGGGLFLCDSNINFVSNHIRTEWYQNWNARADIQYKFAYLERNENGGWLKAHTIGLFVNYGRNSGINVQRMFPGQSHRKVDVLKPARGFIEAELGFMLREELRLSGGGGMMKFNQISDGVASYGSQYYYTCTAGLSPRIFDWLETEMTLTGMLVNGKIIPRIGLSTLFLVRTGNF